MTDTFHLPANSPAHQVNTEDEQSAYVRALCEHHASALVVMACVLLDDIDRATDIVAATLAAACRDEHRVPTDPATRTRLARSAYHRCLGHLATHERFPHPPRTNRSHGPTALVFSHLSTVQRALLALALFGGHDITQLAQTLRLPTATVVNQLSRVLPSMDIASAR